MHPAKFIISLDFELHWGVFDHVSLDARGRAYFDRTRELIPPTLELFRQHGIRATWATVGLLFARDKQQVLEQQPAERPHYQNTAFDPYPIVAGMGRDESDDPYHYAPRLIEKILATPGQELGSHTFSHYYCLEPGQTAAAFRADLSAAQALARQNFGLTLRSLVFPRNQYTSAYLQVLEETGFQTYRTNPDVWFWRAQATREESLAKKAVRLLDHYVPLSPRPPVSPSPSPPISRSPGLPVSPSPSPPVSPSPHPPVSQFPRPQTPASRFFRPYLPKLDAYGGQALKLRRILNEMTRAARTGADYHLWWHPHNLATHPAKNMAALASILQHYRQLHRRYGMESMAMGERTG